MEYRLRHSIGYRVTLAANAMHAMFAKKIEPLGIAPEQYAVLKMISEDQESTSSGIAERLGKGKPTVTRALDALEKKCLVLRAESKNDRRAKRIRLTEEGQKIVADVTPIAKTFNDSIFSQLQPEEAEIFFKVLDTIHHTLNTGENNHDQ